MARIVVTGAAGFIGTRLVHELLAQGHDVTVMRHLREPATDSLPDLRQLRVDITQPSTLRGRFDHCDRVFHLAGRTIARSAADFLRVNRDGTANVAEACAAAETPPRLLFVSSLAAVGPAAAGSPLTESATPAPVSNYGRSKLEAEKILQRFSAKLPIQVVRPPSVMGDSDPYMLGLFKTAKAGWVFLPGSTPFRYSMIHVDDLARAIIHVSQRDDVRLAPDFQDPMPAAQALPNRVQPAANPGLVHLAQDPPLTFVQTAQVIRDLFHRSEVRTIGIPKSLCWLLAAVNSTASSVLRYRALLNLDKMREGLAGEWMADSKHLTQGLGFEFPVTLEERIRQTAQSYHQKGWM